MNKKLEAAIPILFMASPLMLGLLFVELYKPLFPFNIIIPTVGGGIMNFCFWAFYNSIIKPVPILSKTILGNNRTMFLLSSTLHWVTIALLLIFDFSWVFGLF
ncbi:hypothetical protein KKE92_02955 [Candidatus Micrarchaeota archaeon]|nr:hypothetical protein [Candidatus Micrarchaeota archaeon]MBU1681424.1 hypothetical protein [Candidatus Micrarchaeota archaeon]